ncbi:MAG: restriction endonuclease subunit S, partial [Arcobacteraceae bacterium]|nr:restriction endonuclease subunit S [Arcobacteraceae bacterium]
TNNRAMIGLEAYIVSHLGAFYTDNKITNQYIYNFFLTIDFLNYCENPSYPSLKISRVKNIKVPIPPLSEQQRIVSKLDNLFEKIDKSIALHKKNIDESNVFMGSVLSDVFGELEEKYNKKMINEISFVKGGKRVPKGYKLTEQVTPYPYLRVTDFKYYGTICKKKMLYLTYEVYQQIKRYTITDEDLYITNVGNTIGKSGIIPSDLNGANLTENAVKLVYKDKENTSNKFMYYFTKSSIFISQMELATKRMAVPKLAIMRLGEITTPFPHINIQQKVVSYLDQISEKTEKIKSVQKEKMDNLIALKASILDRAFRGQL